MKTLVAWFACVTLTACVGTIEVPVLDTHGSDAVGSGGDADSEPVDGDGWSPEGDTDLGPGDSASNPSDPDDPLVEQDPDLVAHGEIAVAGVHRDRFVFSSAAFQGDNEAWVPLMVSGTAAAEVEARALSVEDDGATTSGWQVIGSIDGAGELEAELSVPRSTSYYLLEARLRRAVNVTDTGEERFGVGYVLAVWGQSDIHVIVRPTGRMPWVSIEPDPLTHDDRYQFVFIERRMDSPPHTAEDLRHHHLTADHRYGPAMTAFANGLMHYLPDGKIAVAIHTVPGSSYFDWANDNRERRHWSDEVLVHDLLTDNDLTRVDLAYSWYSSSIVGLGDHFEEAIAPVISSYRMDGSYFDVATDNPHTYPYNNSVNIHHTLSDLYDFDFTLKAIQKMGSIEASLDSLVANPNFDFYRKGAVSAYADTISGRVVDDAFQDGNHKNAHSYQGSPRLTHLTALSMMDAVDAVTFAPPHIDSGEFAPGGDTSLVRLGSSQGAITTHRKRRDHEALSTNDNPYFHEVMRFWVNRGQGKESAEAFIGNPNGNPATTGYVYVRRPGGGAFRPGDTVGFGGGPDSYLFEKTNVEGVAHEVKMNLPTVAVDVPTMYSVPTKVDACEFDFSASGSSYGPGANLSELRL